MAKIEEYLKTPEGNYSSTRLFSWYMLWFFFLYNAFVALIVGLNHDDINMNFMLFALSTDVILLIAVFVPKQLAKVAEIKGLVDMTQKGFKDEKE